MTSRTTGADNRGSFKRAVMIDTERLFDSLSRDREFTVTDDHLKLLRHIRGVRWDPGEGYGAPFISCKRPYGDSYVPQDVAEILGAPDSDWAWEEVEVPYPRGPRTARVKHLRAEAEERYLRLHVEAGMALTIALATGEFRPGRYTRTDARSKDWKRPRS